VTDSKRECRPWTESERTQLRELYDRHSLAEIAEITGRTKRAVRAAAAKAGLSCSKVRSGPGRGGYAPKWTDEHLQYLHDNYATMSAPEIAGNLGRTLASVYVRAKLEGLKSLHRTGINSLAPDYFRVIDTSVKAYLLGLLMADGTVSKAGQVILALHDKDRCLVELARDEIAPGARLGGYQVRTTPMTRFMIADPGLVADLARHGVVNRKTMTILWPDEVPSEHEGSFVCGYFDGDGYLKRDWLYRWAVTCASVPFLTAMQDHILAATGVRVGGPYSDKRHAAWSLVQTGAPVRAVDAWMHRDVPGLERKRLPQPSQLELDITG